MKTAPNSLFSLGMLVRLSICRICVFVGTAACLLSTSALFTSVLFTSVLFTSALFTSAHAIAKADISYNNTVIVDADTANEVDDPYALVAALTQSNWNVIALTAAQWQTAHWATEHAMEDSHRLNQVMVGYLGTNTPTLRGGVARMYDWGDQAQHSAAAYEIIKQAHKMPKNEKLTLVVLGALTNIASALFIDPSIEQKIDVYWLGSSYDFDKGIMRTTDFNAIMDPQALHLLLNSKVSMTIIPVNVASALTFDYQKTFDAFSGKSHMTDFLVNRWYEHVDGSRKKRVIWDLALIYAMTDPQWAETTIITTSKDLGNRPINYISSIDGEKMFNAFIERTLAWTEEENK